MWIARVEARRIRTTLGAFAGAVLLATVSLSATTHMSVEPIPNEVIVGADNLALIRGISRSLGNAVQLSEAVARGDLTVQVNATGKDEVARVLQSLTAMQHNLAQIVSRVRQGSESVSTASAEIV